MFMIRRASPFVVPMSWLAAFGAVVPMAHASSVVPMNVNRMADLAGQVFIGNVTSVRSYWAEDPKRIESEAVFEQVEYLKGAHAGATSAHTLIVPGGTLGTVTMSIGCAPQFQVGQKWLLFVLPTYKTFPIVGLSQGAFRVRTDHQGIQRVFSPVEHRVAPVLGIDADGFVRISRQAGAIPAEHFVGGTNARLVTSSTRDRETPIRLEDFVAGIRPALAASRDHRLAAPAGRRVPAQLQSAPLQSVRKSPQGGGTLR